MKVCFKKKAERMKNLLLAIFIIFGGTFARTSVSVSGNRSLSFSTQDKHITSVDPASPLELVTAHDKNPGNKSVLSTLSPGSDFVSGDSVGYKSNKLHSGEPALKRHFELQFVNKGNLSQSGTASQEAKIKNTNTSYGKQEKDAKKPQEWSTFNYKQEKINGVNLGGWLVTEPFISPSLYEQAASKGVEDNIPVDEYSLCKKLGSMTAYELLKKHWDTWITETDFDRIKHYGFNAVRLPIGYWAFYQLTDDPYVFGQEEYLEKAIRWCRAYGLKLWIDLHGIPGSQNGFDNSGQRDTFRWMGSQENYDLGIKVLAHIYDKYGDQQYQDVIVGIENLNEPLNGVYDALRILEFDTTTYRMLRERSSNFFVYHDAFLPMSFWEAKLDAPDFQKTVLDHHRYEVFDAHQMTQDLDEHIASIQFAVDQFLQSPKAQVIGEWSAALTDCCKWLNGVGRGSRYDNTFANGVFIGSCRYSNDYRQPTEQDRTNTRRFIEAQLDIYNQTNGFFFWTWKTESAVEWSLSTLADIGLFPVPLDERRYPKAV